MKILVTGGGGFLGSALTRKLIQKGYQVRILLKKNELCDNLHDFKGEIIVGDIRDKQTLKEAMRGIDYVFHTASVYQATPFYDSYPKALYHINVEGTRNVCEIALKFGIKKVIYTGSTASVGLRKDRQPANESVALNFLEKRSHYEKSKAAAEKIALSYHQRGLNIVAINPSFLIGPGDIRPTPTGELIIKFLNQKYPCYFDATLSLTDLDSAVDAHLQALKKGKSGQRYIIAHRKCYTLFELFTLMEKISGVKKPRLKVPITLLIYLAAVNELAIRALGLQNKLKPLLAFEMARYLSLNCLYDGIKAHQELGYKENSIKQALRKSIQWYQQHGYH